MWLIENKREVPILCAKTQLATLNEADGVILATVRYPIPKRLPEEEHLCLVCRNLFECLWQHMQGVLVSSRPREPFTSGRCE